MLNKVIMIGNLTKDPELRYTPQGDAVVTLGLASNRQWKSKQGEQKKDVCFVNIIVWGKRGENCNQYLKKGNPILVDGRLQSRSWDGPDGKKRYATEIVAENIQFLNRTKEGTSPETEEKTTEETWLEESPTEQ